MVARTVPVLPFGSMKQPVRTFITSLTFILLIGPMVFAQGKELPVLNQRIVDFVHDHEGKKVGRGECWDLAAEALNSAGAKWNGFYDFGSIVDWKKDAVLPGDILQLENVEVERREGNSISREHYGQHTAIVVAVHGRGDYEIAQQNMRPMGKKVGTSALRMADVRSGKLTFHRPAE